MGNYFSWIVSPERIQIEYNNERAGEGSGSIGSRGLQGQHLHNCAHEHKKFALDVTIVDAQSQEKGSFEYEFSDPCEIGFKKIFTEDALKLLIPGRAEEAQGRFGRDAGDQLRFSVRGCGGGQQRWTKLFSIDEVFQKEDLSHVKLTLFPSIHYWSYTDSVKLRHWKVEYNGTDHWVLLGPNAELLLYPHHVQPNPQLLTGIFSLQPGGTKEHYRIVTHALLSSLPKKYSLREDKSSGDNKLSWTNESEGSDWMLNTADPSSSQYHKVSLEKVGVLQVEPINNQLQLILKLDTSDVPNCSSRFPFVESYRSGPA